MVTGAPWTLRYQINSSGTCRLGEIARIFLDSELAVMHGEGWYSLADLLGKVEDNGRFALSFEALLQVGEAN